MNTTTNEAPIYFPWVDVSDSDDIPEEAWLIDGMIPEGGLCEMHGLPGCGKTLLSVHYGALVAQDHPVVYIAAEGPNSVRRRIAAWNKHHPEGKVTIRVIKAPVNLRERDQVEQLISQCKSYMPKLVIFDTLACSMAGGEENSSKDMGLVIDACKQIQLALNTAILLIHHTGKNGETERGHSSLRGACDSMMFVKKSGNFITIKSDKLRDGNPFAPEKFQIVPVGVSAVAMPMGIAASEPADRAEMSESDRKVLSYIAAYPNGVRYSDIIGNADVSTSTVERALKKLLRLGHIDRNGKLYVATDMAKAA